MPVSKVVPLEVCLNDGRAYVQGSQMVFRAAEVLATGGDLRLRGAEFHAITNRRVGLRLGSRRTEDLGEILFEGREGAVRAAFVALEERAPPGSLNPAVTVASSIDADTRSAVIRFDGAGDLRQLLDLAVQATKRLHLELSPDARDVWMTGLRRADLPLLWKGTASGSLSVQVLRRLVASGRVQSVNSVALDLDGNKDVKAFVLTFAHRQEV
jgi:hypothetical protein